MPHELSTDSWSQHERQVRWAEAISDTYFPLSLEFDTNKPFDGHLQVWDTPSSPVSLSRLRSSTLGYSRSKAQVGQDNEAFYLVTVPRCTDVHFEQDGRQLSCAPGGFIVERGDAPYRFHYGAENDLWVLKLPERALRGHLRGPERYTRFCFGAERGLGRVFIEQLGLCAANFDDCPSSARHLLLEQTLSTLLLVLQQDERVLSSESSNLSALHLQRVEQFVAQNLADPELSPQSIASACGLSLRYLHKLFAATPYTLGEWVRQQRLEAVHRQLRDPHCHLSIGELAYRWGFSDQAQFTRAFRQQYGCTAREVRNASSH
ncbi:AraC-like ligand-binding domain-containing protein [Metapseudomonas boanensis]|uniref:Helix-turn-helix domain-containing protein n=1 Tax=Metapseudomonas boanensis TaxID=2822138 RepID=A0ABS5XGT8_9GAMM|nr:helix-turn-helix domain-containing protein [Pseudomonas boanensis]MBT8766899.1 helix-turn-helix domain-containing protein [Pseudomonas boanensis]